MADLTGAYTHLALIAIPMQVYGDFSGKASFISVGQPGDHRPRPPRELELPEYLQVDRPYSSWAERVEAGRRAMEKVRPIDERIDREFQEFDRDVVQRRQDLENNLKIFDTMYPVDTGDPRADAFNATRREAKKQEARILFEQEVQREQQDFATRAVKRRRALVNLQSAQETNEANRARANEVREQRRKNLKKARKSRGKVVSRKRKRR